ncbi:unnamed protein product, partial [Candidula unifasciata]
MAIPALNMIMLPSNRRQCSRSHVRHQTSSGQYGFCRTMVSSFVSWTASMTLLISSVVLTQYSRSGSGVAALSCAACDPTLCPDTSDCTGGLVLDICRCCQVCARTENQRCGGMFGILGKCDGHLHCFISPVDGRPITGDEEGICK